MNKKITIIGLVFGVLLLAGLLFWGWGCGSDRSVVGPPSSEDKGIASENAGAGDEQDKVAQEETDEIGDKEIGNKEEFQALAGWKEYKSEARKLSFWYPPNWFVYEDSELGILLSDWAIPNPLPPDILGVPVVIGISDESEEDHEMRLRDRDSQLIKQTLLINGYQWVQYSSAAPVSEYDEPGIEYRLKYNSGFLQIGVNTDTDQSVVQKILESLEF